LKSWSQNYIFKILHLVNPNRKPQNVEYIYLRKLYVVQLKVSHEPIDVICSFDSTKYIALTSRNT
jgi:hypothetical protein